MVNAIECSVARVSHSNGRYHALEMVDPCFIQTSSSATGGLLLRKVAFRYVTHHSARHSFVSVLQAHGVEVGLVAKLAGHANPAVTLAHYTQAVRDGAEALATLDRVYQVQ